MGEKNLWVCWHCLMGIESREGQMAIISHSIDEEDDSETKCDWCGMTAEEGGFDELFEIV